jgi:hypothetical protein
MSKISFDASKKNGSSAASVCAAAVVPVITIISGAAFDNSLMYCDSVAPSTGPIEVLLPASFGQGTEDTMFENEVIRAP